MEAACEQRSSGNAGFELDVATHGDEQGSDLELHDLIKDDEPDDPIPAALDHGPVDDQDIEAQLVVSRPAEPRQSPYERKKK